MRIADCGLRHHYRGSFIRSDMHGRCGMSRTISFLFLLGFPFMAMAAEPRMARDLEYARVGEVSLKLDLYVPEASQPPPVVVWVHGGAWRSGSKKESSLLPLSFWGFAVASV